ncbi:tethering complex subunit PEP5 KNAG_0J00770 [Huiozyma naganishii CBS 8797]|uniref:E3 ubiquitin-protein ligase PEP5 n=1 Tax=Huiozyma naganishii (strain ATCC MYA-139 / BCRC 22969 / CBS 8797 / KCTC 17520 / NBRC 10181 / NCYC 3082 / Yp74L-3) TaxID=1071383 RepID=J7RBA8_HUIN7|nr:hypothetical protein KNAG_0J00770 [Kazachstania naganishii CBS 8797]CCK72160.1 hypothetical protein KNAG_0J00770 [Kazachstania naganishii CBS 8797]
MSWKQFQLWESVPLRDPQLGCKEPFYSDPTLSAATTLSSKVAASETTVIIAVAGNIVKLINLNKSKVRAQFVAVTDADYRITKLKIVGHFLLVVAEALGKPLLLTFYKVDLILASTNGSNKGKPKLSYHAKVEVKNGNNTYPLSCLDISKDLSCIALGFVNGKIIVVRGDLARDRGSRQRVIYEDANKEAITALSLTKDGTLCFASTLSHILVFNTFGRNRGLPDAVLSETHGCDLNCTSWNGTLQEFVCYTSMAGQQPSLESYKVNNEKTVVQLPETVITSNMTPKRLLVWGDSHSLLVIDEETDSAKNTALSVGKINRVIIIDTRYNIVCFNSIINDPILDILSYSRSEVCLLSTNGVLYRLSQHTFKEQINIVTQREDFSFALQLAQRNKLPTKETQLIHKDFADFLYRKGQLREATEHYIQCLDVVETSEVIFKYGVEGGTSSTNIQNLATYLWALVKSNAASEDHVSLLLIVLIKLKSVDQIDHFLHHFSREGLYSEEILENDIDDDTFFYSNKTLFDLQLVLSLFEESGMFMEAYQLARKFAKDPVVVVSVLLNDLEEPRSTLNYIKSLPVDDTLRIIIKFSKRLLECSPNETNVLLIDVFTGNYKPSEYKSIVEAQSTNKSDPNNENDTLLNFYSYKTFISYMNKTLGYDATPTPQKLTSTYHPPKPSLIFPSFSANPFQFVVFLEACLESYQQFNGFKDDLQTILTTLYDLYLSLAADDIPERRDDWRKKASLVWRQSNNLVKSSEGDDKSSYVSGNGNKVVDNSLMMLIKHMNQLGDTFEEDEEEDEDERNILAIFYSMTLTDGPSKCLNYFKRHCDKEPNLYKSALKYFVSDSAVYNAIGGDDFVRGSVIEPMVRGGLVSVLELLQVLSSSSVAKFGLVQQLLIDYVQTEETESVKNQKLADSYRDELAQKRTKLQELLDSEKPSHIHLKKTSCFMCNSALDLPVVYFKCGHIYHRRCLNEENVKNDESPQFRCPKCVADIETSNKLYEMQKQVGQDAAFLTSVLNSKEGQRDRFKVVTDFIGRGGLEVPLN